MNAMPDLIKDKQTKHWWLFAAVAVIVCISYSFYASVNYPLLNSDDGLNILMAHYYDLPADIYCWGQDRLGSIIPLTAQFFMKVFGASAITAVSLSNYTILILGYIGFASLLKKPVSKLLFAVVWFLPYERFIDINRFTIGVEYSLIAFSIFLIRKVRFEGKGFFDLRNHVLLAGITLLLGLSIWASDLAIVTIFLLLFTLGAFHYRKHRKLLPRREVLLYAAGGTLFWTLFIIRAKSYAVVKTEEFASLNSFGDVLRGLSVVKESIWKVLRFRDHDFFLTAYAWLLPVVIAGTAILALQKKVRISEETKKWAFFLFIDVLAVLGVIFLSHWVLINEMGRRYFVATYISLSVLLFLLIENALVSISMRRAVYTFVALTVLVAAISPLYTMKYVSVKTLKPTVETMSEFRKLGHIGIIAEYWNAYRTSCGHLDLIKATPHDKSDVRNPKLVEEVFAQPNLYVIRDMWIERFPDTLKQFGFTLLKDGSEFYTGGCFVCKYKRLPLSHIYSAGELKTDPAFLVNEPGGPVISVNPQSPDAKEKHVVFGPNVALLPGKYGVRYVMEASEITTGKPFAIIDISAGSGQQQLLYKDLTRALFPQSGYRTIEVELEVPHRVSNVEFRLIYSGNASVKLKSIQLIEKP